MEYNEMVKHLEGDLADYAMKSFDSNLFVDGGEVFKFYNDLWIKEGGKEKLNYRTPIQHQRDKILYSNGVRKQSEKYHVLYRGGQRIIRNYITHTMRMMQVTRTICRALRLNEDFAEALALGSKIGALPFIHASKNEISNWIIEKIEEIDHDSKGNTRKLNLVDSSHLPDHPEWIRNIENEKVLGLVKSYIPFATGKDVNAAYSSGKQGYWLLTTNPYTMESQKNSYTPEIMYGIWRHSLNNPIGKDSFVYSQKIKNVEHKIHWSNITFESIVLKYADDITWVIENLNDANNAALLNNPGDKGLFQELFDQEQFDSQVLIRGLSSRDSGKLYSYFINDFIDNSSIILSKNSGIEMKASLKNGDFSSLIGLSSEGKDVLEKFKKFIEKRVFSESRVLNRKRMLETITEGCVDLIYNGKNDYLEDFIKTKAKIEGWAPDLKTQAIDLLDNDIHRIQVAVNVFSELSDQEVFSFVGMESF